VTRSDTPYAGDGSVIGEDYDMADITDHRWALLHLDLEGPVATVTLDRPPANALNRDLMDELASLAEHLESIGPRVVLLRSALAKIFMAGADLDMTGERWDEMDDTVVKFQAVVNAWEQLTMPTIAVIEGHAAGGGCEVALACDFRIMTRSRATIGLPEVRWSLLACGGGTQRMARLLGRGATLDMVLRGRLVDADTAERLGLITRACDPGELDAVVSELCAELVALPPLAVAAAKRAVIRGLDGSIVDGLQLERSEMARLAASDDAREGVQSFREKRSPQYHGR
jgi:enoyl-CoA hydratase